jgi:hypothetical protein
MLMKINDSYASFYFDDYVGCRRCCNVAILFCNKPDLKLSDMGLEDDITIDIEPSEPILPSCYSLLSKALYRRAKCLMDLHQFLEAKKDLATALRCVDGLAAKLQKGAAQLRRDIDTDLAAASESLQQQREVQEKEQKGKEKETSQTQGSENDCSIDKDETETEAVAVAEADELWLNNSKSQSLSFNLTVNGGPCLMRRAAWSQSVDDATVYIPLPYLNSVTHRDGMQNKNKRWRVEFQVRGCM